MSRRHKVVFSDSFVIMIIDEPVGELQSVIINPDVKDGITTVVYYLFQE